MTAPPEVLALAERRAQARAAKEWPTSDRLRAEIRALGWEVHDQAEGWELTPVAPYDIAAAVTDLPDRSAEPDEARCTVALLAEGWPADLTACVEAVVEHSPPNVGLLILDNGDVDGSAASVHALTEQHPGRVSALHLAQPVGWGSARLALLRADVAAVHVVMDPSTVLEGDALTPLLDELAAPDVAAAGWQGVRVRDGWTEFEPAGPGEVEALLGYLFAVRRHVALRVPPPTEARFYRNADLEWSLLIREAGEGRLVVPAQTLPVRQDRHHGYHDSDPHYRDRESRRTFVRMRERFRERDDLRLPR